MGLFPHEKVNRERQAHIPAEHSASKTDARVSRADEHEERAAGAQKTPREGTEAADRQQRITPGMRARFSPSEHIRRRAEFQRVYEHGVRANGRYLTVFLLARGHPEGRLGIAATRKLGGAVERNRAKRLIREVFRRNKIAPGFDVVVVPKREVLDASLTTIEAEYRQTVGQSLRRQARAGRN